MKYLALASALMMSACASAPQMPQETASPFIIERDLAGETVARGTFSAINGTKRGFTAYLTGTRSGETFTLNEKFEYDDGEKDEKTWVLTLEGDGVYTGTREDVIDVARGWQDGPAFRLEYDVRLPGEDGEPGMKVRFRDIMVTTPEGAVLNKARVSKWGFNVGKVDLTIRAPEAG